MLDRAGRFEGWTATPLYENRYLAVGLGRGQVGPVGDKIGSPIRPLTKVSPGWASPTTRVSSRGLASGVILGLEHEQFTLLGKAERENPSRKSFKLSTDTDTTLRHIQLKM
jgi:hypothetical protein